MESHEIEFRVRYKETDGQGVVHHGNYFTWFEMGRVEFLRAKGASYRDMERDGLFLVVARASCRYRAPAYYDDLLRLKTIIKRVSAVKIEHEYEIYRGDELLADGATTLACIDRQGNIQRLPDWLRPEG